MKQYADAMKSGTTPFVICLRFIFLIALSLLALLFVLAPYLLKTPEIPSITVQVGEILLGLICTISGIFIAIKDPAMTMRMLGGLCAAFYIIATVDFFFR